MTSQEQQRHITMDNETIEYSEHYVYIGQIIKCSKLKQQKFKEE